MITPKILSIFFLSRFEIPERFNFVLFSFAVRGARPGKNVQLTETEIKGLCLKSREIFLSQPILLELEAPLKICGKYCVGEEDGRACNSAVTCFR